jgi:hypothetical protein
MPYSTVTEIDDLTVGQPARQPIRHIVDRDKAADLTVRHLRMRRGSEEEVHRPAFVRLDMTEGDPAQLHSCSPEPLRSYAPGSDRRPRLREQICAKVL